MTVRVEENVFHQAQLDLQITLTAGQESGRGVLCKTNNQLAGPEVEPTFRSPNKVGNGFLSLGEYMRCNKGEKEQGLLGTEQ